MTPEERAVVNSRKRAYREKRKEDPAFRAKLAEYNKTYIERHPKRVSLSRRACRIGTITPAELAAAEEAAGGVCPICERAQQLVADHCHKTGKFRGLICGRCNTGLGQFQDDPSLLSKAVAWCS